MEQSYFPTCLISSVSNLSSNINCKLLTLNEIQSVQYLLLLLTLVLKYGKNLHFSKRKYFRVINSTLFTYIGTRVTTALHMCLYPDFRTRVTTLHIFRKLGVSPAPASTSRYRWGWPATAASRDSSNSVSGQKTGFLLPVPLHVSGCKDSKL